MSRSGVNRFLAAACALALPAAAARLSAAPPVSSPETHAMVADIMTKALGNAAFSQHSALLVSAFATGPSPPSA